ncbi:hypothetical protein ACIGKQ_03910 [Gordonia sp. NPDC062954]|uniref:hypothetical protein n=1 Tax=Gordonia sp. NPDC062954 TaxID=3364003 RepID=UPI0037C86586
MNRTDNRSADRIIAHVWRAFPDLYRADADQADGYMVAAEHVGDLLDTIQSDDAAADRAYVRASLTSRINDLTATLRPSAAIRGSVDAYRRALALL